MTSSWPPIIVTGGWGSGTTLLCSMLNSHPDIFIPYETFYLRELWENREALGLTSVRGDEEVRRLFAQFLETSHVSLITQDIPEEAFFDALLAVPADALSHARLLAVLSEIPMRRQGKVRWGAKNPSFVNHLDTIYALYPDSYFRDQHTNIARPPDPVIAQRWRKQLSPAVIYAIQKAISPALKQKGYELVEVDLPALDRQVIDQNVAAWWRERARKALRRGLGEVPLLEPLRRVYRRGGRRVFLSARLTSQSIRL